MQHYAEHQPLFKLALRILDENDAPVVYKSDEGRGATRGEVASHRLLKCISSRGEVSVGSHVSCGLAYLLARVIVRQGAIVA